MGVEEKQSAGEEFGSVEELTRRVQDLEHQLRSSEERSRLILANLPNGLIIARKDFTVEAANSVIESMFGYERTELARRHLSILLPGFDASNAGKSIDIFGRKKSGDLFPASITILETPTPSGARLFIFVSDITEMKRLEQVKREFMAMITHDMKTPLTSVTLFLDLLEEGIYGSINENGIATLMNCKISAKQMLSLTNDLLDLDRHESGRFELEKKETDLKRVCHIASQAVNGLLYESKIDLVSSVEDSAVKLDTSRIVQVLVNLISNAIKFSPNESSIDLGAWHDADSVYFSVRDRGRGIPENLRKSIFSKYVQVEKGDFTRGRGYGLGLAICKSIVDEHGGEIWVENAEGGGSNFTFKLPRG